MRTSFLRVLPAAALLLAAGTWGHGVDDDSNFIAQLRKMRMGKGGSKSVQTKPAARASQQKRGFTQTVQTAPRSNLSARSASSAPGGDSLRAELRKAWFGKRQKDSDHMLMDEKDSALDIFQFGIRSWWTTGRAKTVMQRPAVNQATGHGFDTVEHDDLLFAVWICDMDVRIPQVRWLHVMGEVAMVTWDKEWGHFNERRWDYKDDRGPFSYIYGETEIEEFALWDVNLQVDLLGAQSVTKKGWKDSGISLFYGFRRYREKIHMYDGHIAVEDFNAVNRQWAGLDSSHEYDWKMQQIGMKFRLGFSDFDQFFKGWAALARTSFLWGYYKGKTNWDLREESYLTEADARGVQASIGLEYRRSAVSFGIGYEWLWFEARHGERSDDVSVTRVDDDRHGFYLRLGLAF